MANKTFLLVPILALAISFVSWPFFRNHPKTGMEAPPHSPAPRPQPAAPPPPSAAELVKSSSSPNSTAPPGPAGKNVPGWKTYVSAEYNFEISCPAGWSVNTNYENNYGKPPSGKGAPAYAGETRTLISLERDGPTQDEEGGGDFSDGALIALYITGTNGVVESWTISHGARSLLTSNPAEWVALMSSPYGGDKVEKVPVATNDFAGVIETACNGSDPCKAVGRGRRRLPRAPGRPCSAHQLGAHEP